MQSIEQLIEKQDRESILLQEEFKNAPDEIRVITPKNIIKNSSQSVNGVKTELIKPIQGFTSEQLLLIKRTVAKDATNDELAMFLHIAKKAGLDPFLRELWFIKYRGGETIIMTGRDGFLSIAQKTGEFMGLQSAAIYEGDEFSVDYNNSNELKINHITNPFKKDAGKIVGGWARSKRKNCIDTIEIVSWKDYYKLFFGKVSMWDKFPSAMIKKVAESIALKKQFGISGIVSKEEMNYENEEVNINNKVDMNNLFDKTYKLISKLQNEQRKQAIQNVINSNQFSEEQIKKLQEIK